MFEESRNRTYSRYKLLALLSTAEYVQGNSRGQIWGAGVGSLFGVFFTYIINEDEDARGGESAGLVAGNRRGVAAAATTSLIYNCLLRLVKLLRLLRLLCLLCLLRFVTLRPPVLFVNDRKGGERADPLADV